MSRYDRNSVKATKSNEEDIKWQPLEGGKRALKWSEILTTNQRIMAISIEKKNVAQKYELSVRVIMQHNGIGK